MNSRAGQVWRSRMGDVALFLEPSTEQESCHEAVWLYHTIDAAVGIVALVSEGYLTGELDHKGLAWTRVT